MRTIEKAVFFFAATPAVVRAAARVARRAGKIPFDEMVTQLSAARPFRWRFLAGKPGWLQAVADFWAPLLPPYAYGLCLKRSLVLADLWSRSNLDVRVHLGFRTGKEAADGHAWASAERRDAPGVVVIQTADQSYAEAFRY